MDRKSYITAALTTFLAESNAIEGIRRPVTPMELLASEEFLANESISIEVLNRVQAVYAPDKPLRTKSNMNVQVGGYKPPQGSSVMPERLNGILQRINEKSISPWLAHVEFEMLHPYMDGNGRTGRILWAWHMDQMYADPFGLTFLHRFYYQTLRHSQV